MVHSSFRGVREFCGYGLTLAHLVGTGDWRILSLSPALPILPRCKSARVRSLLLHPTSTSRLVLRGCLPLRMPPVCQPWSSPGYASRPMPGSGPVGAPSDVRGGARGRRRCAQRGCIYSHPGDGDEVPETGERWVVSFVNFCFSTVRLARRSPAWVPHVRPCAICSCRCQESLLLHGAVKIGGR